MSKKNNKSSVKKAKANKPAKNKAVKGKPAKKTAVKKVVKKVKPVTKKAVKAKKVKPSKPAKKIVAKAKIAKVKAKTIVKAKIKVTKPAKVKAVKPVKVKAVKIPKVKKEKVIKIKVEKAPKIKVEKAPKIKKEKAPKPEVPEIKISKKEAKAILKASEKLKKQAEENVRLKLRKAASEEIDVKPTYEPPGKIELEYVVHSSAELLFTFLTEPSGLSEWFCDDVNVRNGIYTFLWDGSQQQAKELKIIPEKLARFQWLEKNDGSYFEFRIERDELTSDISLIITDFAETEEERTSSKLLWDSQIDKLLHVMGAYF